MMKKHKIRNGTSDDIAFLKEMLYEAVFWSQEQERISLEELFKVPEISKILEYWNKREGDFSLIAIDEGNKPIGAVWYRYWTEENHSFGFVNSDIPEVGISVVKNYRGKGIGTELMKVMMDYAKVNGVKQLSLSVDPRNYALRFYEKLGYTKVSESGTSWTMVKELN